MPYGCMGFRCERCGEELLTYRLYCWCCGAKQPEMKEVRSFRGESDVDIINTKLKRTRGWEAQLWSYRVSHSELEIRLKRPGENLTLMCIASFSISTPAHWTSSLIINQQKDEIYNDTVFLIQDEPAGVLVKCRRVELFYNVPPVY
jgi:hypothetical protein